MMKAILTGHTRGLGAAIAEQLLGRQIAVLGLSRHTHAGLAERFPALLKQVEIDLSDSAALTRWCAGNALSEFVADRKSLLLINNAGTVQPVGSLGAQHPEQVARAVGLNVAAPLMLTTALVAASWHASTIRILHVSSGAGRSAYPGWSIYCATKAALDHHARAACLEKITKVRICSLAPGVIDTDMQAEIRATSKELFPLRERFEDLKRHQQLASPARCAEQVVNFLLSNQFGDDPVADLREMSQ